MRPPQNVVWRFAILARHQCANSNIQSFAKFNAQADAVLDSAVGLYPIHTLEARGAVPKRQVKI
jgi:hypothetical protein